MHGGDGHSLCCCHRECITAALCRMSSRRCKSWQRASARYHRRPGKCGELPAPDSQATETKRAEAWLHRSLGDLNLPHTCREARP